MVRLADAVLLEGIAYELDDMRDERVLRLGWTRATSSGWSLEFGGEGAYNRLSSETGLFTIDAQNLRTRINLPIETAIVSEHRGEVFTNLVRNVSSRIRLDFGVAYEASRLEVRGGVECPTIVGILPTQGVDRLADRSLAGAIGHQADRCATRFCRLRQRGGGE